jgi:hypothetical protein
MRGFLFVGFENISNLVTGLVAHTSAGFASVPLGIKAPSTERDLHFINFSGG